MTSRNLKTADGKINILKIDVPKLLEVCNALYGAGHWTCDRSVDEAKLWENLRDEIGRESGTSPKPLPDLEIPAGPPIRIVKHKG